MATEILLLWLPSLAISIISVLVFIYLSFRNRQKIDELRQRAHDYAQQQTEHFLQREVQTTRLRIKLGSDSSTLAIDKLRLIWLEAELVALVDQGKRRSNYELLLHAVQPIVRLTSPLKTAAATSDSLKQAALQLQKVRTTLSSQNAAISQYRQSIATAKRDADQPQPIEGFNTALGKVEQNSADLVATVARLETELAALQEKLTAAEQQKQNTVIRKSETQDSGIFVVSAPTAQTEKMNAARELLEVSDQAYRQSVTEINRMREINTQQRQLILQLEKELQLVRKDTEQYEMSSQVLEKLKLQLRDYETCTVILEEEADTLRGKIDVLHKAIAQDQDNQALPAGEFLAEAVQTSTPILSPKTQTDILPLLADIVELKTAQPIAAKLTEWLRLQKLSAVVFLRKESEQIWSSSEGGVDTHSKQLLQSIVPVADQPRFDVGEGILFAYPICRVLIYQNSALNDNAGELAMCLQVLTKIIDRWLAMLQNKQVRGAKSGSNDLHSQLNGLLAQYKYISAEHSRMGAKFQAELNHFFLNTDISEIQQQVVTSMMDDYRAQLDIIGKASKLIYTRLKAIAEDIESPEAMH